MNLSSVMILKQLSKLATNASRTIYHSTTVFVMRLLIDIFVE